jgi:hypothetical protein
LLFDRERTRSIELLLAQQFVDGSWGDREFRVSRTFPHAEFPVSGAVGVNFTSSEWRANVALSNPEGVERQVRVNCWLDTGGPMQTVSLTLSPNAAQLVTCASGQGTPIPTGFTWSVHSMVNGAFVPTDAGEVWNDLRARGELPLH